MSHSKALPFAVYQLLAARSLPAVLGIISERFRGLKGISQPILTGAFPDTRVSCSQGGCSQGGRSTGILCMLTFPPGPQPVLRCRGSSTPAPNQ